jgi:hypothetical protein
MPKDSGKPGERKFVASEHLKAGGGIGSTPSSTRFVAQENLQVGGGTRTSGEVVMLGLPRKFVPPHALQAGGGLCPQCHETGEACPGCEEKTKMGSAPRFVDQKHLNAPVVGNPTGGPGERKFVEPKYLNAPLVGNPDGPPTPPLAGFELEPGAIAPPGFPTGLAPEAFAEAFPGVTVPIGYPVPSPPAVVQNLRPPLVPIRAAECVTSLSRQDIAKPRWEETKPGRDVGITGGPDRVVEEVREGAEVIGRVTVRLDTGYKYIGDTPGVGQVERTGIAIRFSAEPTFECKKCCWVQFVWTAIVYEYEDGRSEWKKTPIQHPKGPKDKPYYYDSTTDRNKPNWDVDSPTLTDPCYDSDLDAAHIRSQDNKSLTLYDTPVDSFPSSFPPGVKRATEYDHFDTYLVCEVGGQKVAVYYVSWSVMFTAKRGKTGAREDVSGPQFQFNNNQMGPAFRGLSTDQRNKIKQGYGWDVKALGEK